jgi:adenine-specific DNA-methyltransferase
VCCVFHTPHLAHHCIDVLIELGIKPGTHRILDPASGGAAFLVPLAARIALDARQRGIPPEAVLQIIEGTLAGVEIDPKLASLSRTLLADFLRDEIAAAARPLSLQIVQADTLNLPVPHPLYDAIVGNPPYGRIFRPSKALIERFETVVTDGYVNLYALFIEQALRWVRPTGIICLIVPISFIGGPYFADLRKRILETACVLRVDPIDKRSDVFLDVLYDVCVLVLQ